MRIQTPDDFLKSLQTKLGQTIPNDIPKSNIEYRKQVDVLYESLNLNDNKQREYGLDSLISEFWGYVDALDRKDRTFIRKKVAIGNVRYNKINACATKGDDFYAIIFYYGLYLYLNKQLKLLSASNNPEEVIYCNRIPKEKYSKEVFREYSNELSVIYKTYKQVSGAMVLLKPNFIIGVQLSIIEIFILCHELGHLLNGDLEKGEFTTSLYSNSEEQIISDIHHHKFEYLADLKGFELMLTMLVNKHKKGEKPTILPMLIFNTLTLNFDFFSMLAPPNSDSHPHPEYRLFNIVETFYGRDACDFLIETYKNPDILQKESKFYIEISSRLNKYFT